MRARRLRCGKFREDIAPILDARAALRLEPGLEQRVDALGDRAEIDGRVENILHADADGANYGVDLQRRTDEDDGRVLFALPESRQKFDWIARRLAMIDND